MATEMFKVKYGIVPPLLEEFFLIGNPTYNLRNKKEFKSHIVKTVSFGTESLAFVCPKIWDKLPIYLKSLNSLHEFKQKVKNWVPQVKTVSFGTESLAFVGPEIWDKLPIYLKSLNSLDEFKPNVKNWVPQDCSCRSCQRNCKAYTFSLKFLSDSWHELAL